MSLLEENLRSLAAAGGDAGAALDGIVPAELRVQTAKNGSVTALWEGVLLHSRVDPEKEARRLVESAAATPEGAEAAVFYGFGLAYHIEAFFRMHPRGRAVVLEPDPALFAAALRVRPYRELFAREGFRLLLAVPSGELAAVLGDWESGSFRVIRHRPACAANPGYFAEADEALSRLASRREININTLKRFGRLWVRNLARNIRLIREVPGIRHLEGAFSGAPGEPESSGQRKGPGQGKTPARPGIPGLVLAAGPSLDQVLPRLRELRRRCLLIAVDTSHAACLRAGVEPDFVVVVDPQYWNTRHLDRVGGSGRILVSESSTHPRVFRIMGGKLFLAGSVFPLGAYLEEASDSKGRLGAGGSVATSAWDLARLLGTDPIVMAGLDLGFPGGGTHFAGSFFEERSLTTADRFRPAETASASYLCEAGPRRVPANDGGMTLTDRRMLVYIHWFESQLRLHRDRETLNLSPGGVAIRGMRFVGIESILALEDRRAAIDERLGELTRVPAAPADPQRFHAALQGLEEELRRLAGLCRRGLAVVDRGPGGSGAEDLAELDGIDREISSLRHRDIAGFLLTSTLTEIEGAVRGDPRAVRESSRRLYRDLLESAEYHLRVLNGAH